jgi:threonine aldolase
VEILFPVEANAVFVKFDPRLVAGLHESGWHFYDFIGAGGSRLMCSWDTCSEDVEHLARDAARLAADFFPPR